MTNNCCRAKDLIPPTLVQNDLTLSNDLYGDGCDSKDIYDFHDDSDREEEDCFNFMIDENPKKKKGIKTKLPGKEMWLKIDRSLD